jgi:pyruvate/2-oxoglutarate dehydrogenase complex dihydrolipoamide dehydrogenase (E3) component
MNTVENASSAQLLKTTEPEEYDLVILGGGTGSTIAAWTFAGQGQGVAVIDRKYIGGSCPHIACLPSKNIIHSAGVVRDNLNGGNSVTTGRQVPFSLFTDPEFARVGLSEKAKAQGRGYRLVKISMERVLRAAHTF